MKKTNTILILFLTTFCSNLIAQVLSPETPGYNQVYFEDNFNSQAFTSFYWGGNLCTDDTHENHNNDLLGTGEKKGYCKVENGRAHFITKAFDIRRQGDLRGPEGARYAKKGGGEIAQGYKATNINDIENTSLENDLINNNNNLLNEARKYKIENGITYQGWDYTGESYLQEGNIVKYHYRFKIKDVSMLEDGLSEKAYLFQQHTQNDVGCRDSTFAYEREDGTIYRHDKMAPTAGMLLAKEGGVYKLKFATKNRDHPYYRNPNAFTQVCENGEDDLQICSTTLYEEDLILNEWYNVTVEMKIAKQTPPSTIPNCTIQSGVNSSYENCRPSEGYLSLIINGSRKTGNVSSLPWAQGKKYFRGVTTQFNNCPSYSKLGNYSLGYNYTEFNKPDHIDSKLEIKFDYFKISNSVASPAGSAGNVSSFQFLGSNSNSSKISN